MVQPLSAHYVAVRLDYWQLFQGENSTQPGPFLRKVGYKGLDTGGQVILTPSGKLIEGHRSWKNNNGFTARELRAIAAKYSSDRDRKEMLRLSWFLLDPVYFNQDLGGNKNQVPTFTSAGGAITEARKARRPLVRVDGAAARLLEANQEFLERHLRQFWWQRGYARAPARLVVLHSNDFVPGAKSNGLTGDCGTNVPKVMANIVLSTGVELNRISPVLDACWREYMANRPSNADNLSFAKENIARFKSVDEEIRRLARSGQLLAPGGRRLARSGR